MRPRLLDLFCCAGGAAVGYHRAGFDVFGVDIKPQPNYPFAFVQMDALEFLKQNGRGFDAIHASPPCQFYSFATSSRTRASHPDLVADTRQALVNTGRPYIIENVPRAPLLDPTMLCGSMFGLGLELDGAYLQLRRHRLFESNIRLAAPAGCAHRGLTVSVAGHEAQPKKFVDSKRWPYRVRAAVMGIDWMKSHELVEAIPPAYTEWLGGQLLAEARRRESA